MTFWLPFFPNDLTKLISKGFKPSKDIVYYKQKNNRLCTYFAASTCIAYNTGIKMTLEEILELWKDHTIANGKQTALKLAERYDLKVYEVDIKDWIRRGSQWAISVSLSVPPEFYLDGQDGKVGKNYDKKLWTWHQVCLYRKGKRIIAINSWWIPEIDITDQIMDMIQKKSISAWIIIV